MTTSDYYPKVTGFRIEYGDEFDSDCVFTHPEGVISLGKSGALSRDLTYLEPACGIGNLSQRLRHNGYDVTSSDILDWGHGDVRDIADYETNSYDVVITNPPFSQWEKFIWESLRIARRHVYLLFKTRYLEGQRRSMVYENTHLSRVLVFRYRLRMYRPNGKMLSSMVSYAWYHWDLNPNRPNITTLEWLSR